MSKTYIRKCRAGWKVVHTEQPGTTVVAPLTKEDAITVRDTFKQRGITKS